MTVYADILFLVNMSLNWLSLVLTLKIVKHKSTTPKLLISAAVGAALGTVTLFLNTISAAFVEIGTSFLMCAIAFSSSSVFDYLKICSCLFASGITLGGSLTLIYSFFNRAGFQIPEQNDISAALFLLLSVFVTISAAFFEKLMFTKRYAKHGNITFTYNKKLLSLDFLCDSGNLLREPISGKPAVIVKASELEGFLPKELLEFDPCNTPSELTGEFKRMRLLPAATVCSSALMTGFIPDDAIINIDKKISHADCIIAIDSFSHPSAYSGYKAIVPTALI